MPEPTINDIEIDESTGLPLLPPGQIWRVESAGRLQVAVRIIHKELLEGLARFDYHWDLEIQKSGRKVEYEKTDQTEEVWELDALLGVVPWPRKVSKVLFRRTIVREVTPSSVTCNASSEAVLNTAKQMLFRIKLSQYRQQVDKANMDSLVGDYPPKTLQQETNVAKVES